MTSLEDKNENLRKIVLNTRVDESYRYTDEDLIEEKIRWMVENCVNVVDFGKSSRHRYEKFRPGQVRTVDINKYEGYPDILDDICDLKNIPSNSLDGVICLSIIEHVYDPVSAITNIRKILKPGAPCLVYVPFLYRYHAPADSKFLDLFRFTRDGIAYLFRDFSEVTIYPCRGPYSSIISIWKPWQVGLERLFGQQFNKIVDKVLTFLYRQPHGNLQVSGNYVWAIK